jgi:capsular polysaccharide biosynthesis protein
MKNMVVGFMLGLVVATVGFSGVARLLDRGVDTIKQQSQELSK